MSAYGALDLDRELPPAPFAAITRFHLVGGLELPVSDGLHAQTEVGLGIGDDSPHDVSVGLAWTIED